MRKFCFRLFVSICLFALFFEMFVGSTSTIFSLRQFYSDIKRKTSTNDELNLKNEFNYNLDGDLIKLRTNNIGFLSHSDFIADSLETKIIIIGDSFIESKQCGTNNSIAFHLDESQDSEVYNFGKGGWNIHDYFSIYKKYELEKAKIVFILLTGIDDISWKKRINKTKISKSKLINHFNDRFYGNKKQSPDYSLLKNNYNNIVYVLHDGLLKENVSNEEVLNDIIQVNSFTSSYRLSDGHYNAKGNKLIADLLINYMAKK
jgi:hypothetical protein